MQLLFVALRSAVFAAAFFWLWTWIALLLSRFDPMLGGPLPPWTAAAGIWTLSAGAVLAFWCVGAFIVRGRGTPALFDPPRRFVAAGPYRFVRNPMYAGGALLLLGFGLAQRSPAIVLFVPGWWLLFHLLVVFYEERALHAKFGAEYDDYRRRTPRWIPRLPLAAFVLAAGATLQAAGGQPDFTGRWARSASRSNFGLLPPPGTRVDRIDHSGPALRLSSTQTRDGRESTATWDCRLDGSACAVSIRGVDLRLETCANWDGPALVFESQGEYNGGQVRISDRWTLSPDRKTLTIARRLSGEAGETQQTLVFEMQ